MNIWFGQAQKAWGLIKKLDFSREANRLLLDIFYVELERVNPQSKLLLEVEKTIMQMEDPVSHVFHLIQNLLKDCQVDAAKKVWLHYQLLINSPHDYKIVQKQIGIMLGEEKEIPEASSILNFLTDYGM